uniref:Uncharacterized protein n=1 Tax=Acrobeloides nanus TaxID=290746 RepID=A0A914DHL8_9BILA
MNTPTRKRKSITIEIEDETEEGKWFLVYLDMYQELATAENPFLVELMYTQVPLNVKKKRQKEKKEDLVRATINATFHPTSIIFSKLL